MRVSGEPTTLAHSNSLTRTGMVGCILDDIAAA